MTAPLKSAAERFHNSYLAAVADEDQAAVDNLDMLCRNVVSFIRLYDFIYQVISYEDTDLENACGALSCHPVTVGRTATAVANAYGPPAEPDGLFRRLDNLR